MGFHDPKTLDIYTLAPLIITEFDGAELTEGGKYEGSGTAHFSSGNKYEGPFPRGCMEGTGSYTWRNGVKYEGEFKANKITGRGTYTWKDGLRYEGQVQNGLRHGKGTFFCEPISSAWYTGDWKDGKVCGQGKLTYSDNNGHNYEGTWLNGLKHGHGVMRYASGNVYDGEWENNVKQGKGIMHWIDRGETYDGEWRDGRPCGYGMYTWTLRRAKPHVFPMSNSYRGDWENGKQHGYGIFQYAHGARYVGNFKEGMKHGHGSFISENGRQYVGEWLNDRPVGTLEPYQNGTTQTHMSSSCKASTISCCGITVRAFHNFFELRAMYSYYAQPQRDSSTSSISADKERIPSIMTQVDLCRFMKDCGVLEKKVTLADCGRIYARQYENNDCYAHIYNSPHAPETPFVYYDLLSYLLRVSYLLYKGRTDLSLFDKGLAAGFGAFLKQDVLKKADLASSDDEMQNFAKELAANVEAKFVNQIYTLYSEKAQHRPGKSLPHSAADITMTMREVLLMLSEYGMLNEEKDGKRDKHQQQNPLSVSRVIEVFATSGAQVSDEGSYNLEYEVQ
ncbi:hypothetical protein DFJ77DRAFT_426196 [Powellomyces hirtus]|nr:hypothetical protein DFJ77DRAFT_426196 [Powellomyces hirtus]